MTKQQDLHHKGLKHTDALEKIIDELKSLGPCPLDMRNALLNLEQHIRCLLDRFPRD